MQNKNVFKLLEVLYNFLNVLLLIYLIRHRHIVFLFCLNENTLIINYYNN